ncbi:YaiI/YqxD family protein [Ectothiorhodospiraceae bacterium BW-2]|nr:YaiI/YqxD family protein [Ectothiorhodospiraceae bacterium BW-2]
MWVDADACPVVIKEILFRAAKRTGVSLQLVANHAITVPRAANIGLHRVGAGFDIADNWIVQQVDSGDIVITADIPLAAEVIDKGANALSPRGDWMTAGNIRAKLNMRDFMETMRASGVQTGGPPPLSQNDRKAFADHLDRWLAGIRGRARAEDEIG